MWCALLAVPNPAQRALTGCCLPRAQAAGTPVVDPAVLQNINDIVNRVKQGLP